MMFSVSSFVFNALSDMVLPVARCYEMAQMYLAGHELCDHWVSSVFGYFISATLVF